MSDYELPRDGIDAQVKREQSVQQQLREIRGANAAESLTITGPDGISAYDPATGGRINLSRGSIWLWSDADTSPETPGQIFCDPGSGINYLRIFPPYSDGSGLENSITVQGRREGQGGRAWIYAEDQISARCQNENGDLSGNVHIGGTRIDLVTGGALGLYSLPTASATANLHLGDVGGEWTVARVTSSRRYKQDIADADIDADAVLKWRPRTWRDKSDVEATGDDAAEHIGFIAEEVAEHTPEFVVNDENGEPDALKYDRMVAGLLTVVQRQAEQVADLTARIDALEAA